MSVRSCWNRIWLTIRLPSTVSQFTLLASTKKGNKPSFHKSASPSQAKELYDKFFNKVRSSYVPERVKDGVFQAMMDVGLVNDGPVGVDYCCEDGVVNALRVPFCVLSRQPANDWEHRSPLRLIQTHLRWMTLRILNCQPTAMLSRAKSRRLSSYLHLSWNRVSDCRPAIRTSSTIWQQASRKFQRSGSVALVSHASSTFEARRAPIT